jgi:hypothetical protein
MGPSKYTLSPTANDFGMLSSAVGGDSDIARIGHPIRISRSGTNNLTNHDYLSSLSGFSSAKRAVFNDWLLVGRNQKGCHMADKQTPEDKAAAFREYQEHQQSIMERTAVLRFERMQREASGEDAPPPEKPALARRRRAPRDR